MTRWLVRESKEWQDEGIIDEAQREKILSRYNESGWQQMVLSLLAGSAIGASILALWALLVFEMDLDALQDDWPARGYFLAFGIPLVIAGLLMKRDEWARPLLLGGLFPLVASAVVPDADWFTWTVMVALIGGFVFAMQKTVRPVLLQAAILILIPIATSKVMDEEPGIATWFGMTAAFFAVTWLLSKPWTAMGKLTTSVALIISWLAFVLAVLEPDFDGGISLVFSMGMIAMVALAIWQKESPPTLAFGLALTAGLVVFAFESGGPIAGVIALVTLSAGFLFLSFRKKS